MQISRFVDLISYLDSWVRTVRVPVTPPFLQSFEMNLQKEYVHYLSKRIVEELIEREMIEVNNISFLQERVLAVLEEELSLEDRINEEVRILLKDYTEEMRRTGVSYQEMFKVVKNRLVKDKKVIL